MGTFQLDGPSDIHRDGVPDEETPSVHLPDPRIIALAEQREMLIVYLLAKVKAGDFHAVQDAASDIREIHAKLEILMGHPT